MKPDQITLQINLSPGDIAYAHLTVPALIEQHTEVDEVLLVVDTCKPGKTKLVDPEMRFPEPQFSEKVAKIVSIATAISERYKNCRIYVLKMDDPIITSLGDKYLNGWYYHTHDYGGCANMSYWLGFDLPDTQYVLHYDADMLLYQKKGYQWTTEAIQLMRANKHAVAACPRYNTPFPSSDISPSFKHGVPFQKAKDCWLDTFFSTRCLLIDKARFQQYLPLLTGRILLETLSVKYLNRGYPRSPEIVMYRKIGGNKGKRLILDRFDSWTMHPHSKPVEYIQHLEAILDLVHKGIYPAGHTEENIELDKWLALVKSDGNK
jgi:hypothetical protein